MVSWTGDARGVQSRGKWKFEPLPAGDNVHVITNVGQFAHCRRDRFCRCRKCKPPLKGAN